MKVNEVASIQMSRLLTHCYHTEKYLQNHVEKIKNMPGKKKFFTPCKINMLHPKNGGVVQVQMIFLFNLVFFFFASKAVNFQGMEHVLLPVEVELQTCL